MRWSSLTLVALIATLAVIDAESVHADPIAGATATFQANNSSPNAFVIENTSDAGSGIQITGLTINLGSNLIFDTASGGAGTGGFQDFLATSDPTLVGLVSSPSVSDGATTLSLSFTAFDPGLSFTFTIDVDRFTSGPNYHDGVNASQFAGSTIEFAFSGPFVGSPLDAGPQAIVHPFGDEGAEGTRAGVEFSQEVQSLDTTPVPEPTSLALWGLVGLGLAAAKRRRKHVQA